jgi:hypothetical protein
MTYRTLYEGYSYECKLVIDLSSVIAISLSKENILEEIEKEIFVSVQDE